MTRGQLLRRKLGREFNNQEADIPRQLGASHVRPRNTTTPGQLKVSGDGLRGKHIILVSKQDETAARCTEI